jgi:ribosomal-protein-alanine N-acetyltransferase
MNTSIDISNTRIETERLILRAWFEDDLADFYTYASYPGVGEMAGWRHHESLEISKRILSLFILEKEVFALELKENARVIGSLGLHHSWANDDSQFADMKSKEIGYVLSRDYWGQGLMSEAVAAVIAFCFEEIRLRAAEQRSFLNKHSIKA